MQYRASGAASVVQEQQTPRQDDLQHQVTDDEWDHIDQLQVDEDWVAEHMPEYGGTTTGLVRKLLMSG